jgi:hypothetical protein
MIQPQTQETAEYRDAVELAETKRHRLLAAGRRRIILTILPNQSPPIHLQTLAEKVAKRESDGETVEEDTSKRVMETLHHTHLPMMEDLGLLRYDSETNHVEFAESWAY